MRAVRAVLPAETGSRVHRSGPGLFTPRPSSIGARRDHREAILPVHRTAPEGATRRRPRPPGGRKVSTPFAFTRSEPASNRTSCSTGHPTRSRHDRVAYSVQVELIVGHTKALGRCQVTSDAKAAGLVPPRPVSRIRRGAACSSWATFLHRPLGGRVKESAPCSGWIEDHLPERGLPGDG